VQGSCGTQKKKKTHRGRQPKYIKDRSGDSENMRKRNASERCSLSCAVPNMKFRNFSERVQQIRQSSEILQCEDVF
jgi:hypothetical protein